MKLIDEFWAFIPARSGSKGLKSKNIINLAGLPLLVLNDHYDYYAYLIYFIND